MKRVICRLKEVIARYEVENDERLTYERIAESTGLSERTLRRWANNEMEHRIIVELCDFFEVQPGDLLSFSSNCTKAGEEE